MMKCSQFHHVQLLKQTCTPSHPAWTSGNKFSPISHPAPIQFPLSLKVSRLIHSATRLSKMETPRTICCSKSNSGAAFSPVKMFSHLPSWIPNPSPRSNYKTGHIPMQELKHAKQERRHQRQCLCLRPSSVAHINQYVLIPSLPYAGHRFASFLVSHVRT